MLAKLWLSLLDKVSRTSSQQSLIEHSRTSPKKLEGAALVSKNNKMRIVFQFDVISPYSALSWKVLMRYKSRWRFTLVPKPVFLGGIMQATGNKPPAMLPPRAKFVGDDLKRNAAFFNTPLLPPPSNFFTEVARSCISCQRLIVAAQQSQRLSESSVEMLIGALMEGMHIDPSKRTADNKLLINEEFLDACISDANISSLVAVSQPNVFLVVEIPIPKGMTHSSVLPTRSLISSRFVCLCELQAEIKAAMDLAEVKDRLKSNTEEAIASGAFGSPTMIVTAPEIMKPLVIFGSDRFEQLAFLTGREWLGPVPGRLQSRL